MDDPTTPTAPTVTVVVPGGTARVAAEVRVPVLERADEELVLQALEGAHGPLVRLGYRRAGRVVRGPVTATHGELADLVAAAGAHPAFAAAGAALGTRADPDGSPEGVP